MGRAAHGHLGIETQTLDQPLATSFRLASPNGALVSSVEPHSAAAKAGVKIGDVIVKFDGQRVDDSGQLSSRVSMFAPGDLATLELVRAGAPVTVQARIESDLQPEELTAREAALQQRKAVTARAQLGLALRALNSRELLAAGVGGGLLVEDAQGSAAAAGIEEGNIGSGRRRYRSEKP
ncbi:MAG: PDZ domain-containing protein [Gammaproteobacteria bacterium]